MKKTIKYLLLTHLITIPIALLSHANPYTMIVAYDVQSILLILLIFAMVIRTKNVMAIIFSIFSMFITMPMLWFTLLILLASRNGAMVGHEGGPSTFVVFGPLVVSTVVFSSIAFAVNAIVEYKIAAANNATKRFNGPSYSFFASFLRTTPLILMVTIFLMLKAAHISVVFVILIKMVFDTAALAADNFIENFNPKTYLIKHLAAK